MRHKLVSFYRIIVLLGVSIGAPHSYAASTVPQAIGLNGQLFDASSEPLLSSRVDFKIQIFDAAGSCVLYSETQAGYDLSQSEGRFALVLGAGSARVNNVNAGTTLDSSVFANVGVTSVANCASPTVALNPGDTRQIRVSYSVGGPFVAMTPDVPLVSTASAMIADSVQGKTSADFVQVASDGSTALTQTNAAYAFSSVNWPRLKALLDGTSTQYVETTPTAPLDMNAQKIIDLADPTLAQDAVTKAYADRTVAGQAIDASTVGLMRGDKNVIQWDQTLNKWVAAPVDTTPTGSAGGALTGTYPNPGLANGVVKSVQINAGAGPNQLLITNSTDGSTVVFGTCAVNQVYAWTVTGWACTNVSSLAPVTSVATKTGAVTLNAGDIGGLGTAALYDVGTAAGQIPLLDASARLPVVDGSLLTNVNAVALQGRAVATTAPTSGQALAWNSTTSQWSPQTVAAGGVTSVATGNGLLGGTITTTGTLTVDSGTGANKVVQLNANAQIALDDGLATLPSYSFSGNTATGLQSPGLNQLSLITSGTPAVTITPNGFVGFGTVNPASGVDFNFTGTGGSALIVPRDTVAHRPGSSVNGMIRYATDTNQFEAYQNGSWQKMIGGMASSAALSGLTAATASNAIDSANFPQTWNWSTLTGQTALHLAGNAVDTGSLLSLTSSSGALNSANGLFNVTNSGTSSTGVVARIQANANAGSGLTVAASGNVGVNTTAPAFTLDVTGDVSVSNLLNLPLSSSQITAWGVSPAFQPTLADTAGVLAVMPSGASTLGTLTVAGSSVNGSANFTNLTQNDVNASLANAAPGGQLMLSAGGGELVIGGNGLVGVGTAAPRAALEVTGTGSLASALIVPRDTVGNRPSTPVNGMIRYASDTSKFEIFQGGLWQNLLGGTASSVSLSGLTAATAVNTIDNANFAQTWNWSTAMTESVRTESANALTTGSLLSLTSSSNALNSTNGLFNVVNRGSSSAGMLGKIQANAAGNSGLFVLANGQVGIGTSAPTSWGSSNRTALQIDSGTTSGAELRLTTPSDTFRIFNRPGAVGFGSDTATDLIFFTNNGTNDRLHITPLGLVGINNTTPQSGLDIATTGTGASAVIVPRDTVSNRPSTPVNGMIRYASDTNKLEAYQNGSWQNMLGGTASSTPLSGLTAATGVNTIENNNFAQTWNWSTATSQNVFGATGNALTTGSLWALSSSSNSLNSTNGLFSVANTGTSQSGILARFQANSATTGAGLSVLTNGNVGVGISAPTYRLHVPWVSGDAVSTSFFGGNNGSNNLPAITAQSWTGNAIVASTNTGRAIQGASGSGDAIYGSSTTGVAVKGQSSAGSSGYFQSGLSTNTAPTLQIAQNGTGSGDLQQWVNSGAGVLMTVKSSGNVGVGTSAPAALLNLSSSGTTALLIDAFAAAPAFVGRGAHGSVASPTASQIDDKLAWFTGRGFGATGFGASGVAGMYVRAAENFTDANQGGYLTFETSATGGSVRSERMRITANGLVGIGGTPLSGLDIATTGTGASAVIVPRDTVANRPSAPVNGMIRYASDTNKLEAYQNGAWQNMLGGTASSSPLSGLTPATAVNSIDNANFAQTWNWSTATTEQPLTLSANALTTGSLLSVQSSGASFNSTNGLLNVANTGAATNGMVARVQSNSSAGSGLSVLANGNVGINTTTPAASLNTYLSATGTTGAIVTDQATMLISPTGSTSATYTGLGSNVQVTTSNAISNVYGVNSYVNNTNSGNAGSVIGVFSNPVQSHAAGTLQTLRGVYALPTNLSGNIFILDGTYNYAINAQAFNVTNVTGVRNDIRNVSSGTISNAYGSSSYIYNNGTGTIGTAYGTMLYAPNNFGSGSINTYYGLYVQTPTAANTNYAIYSQGGTNYFGGNVGVGTTTPASVLNLSSSGTTALLIDAYATTPGFVGRGAQGSVTSPAASQVDDKLSWFAGRGYGATSFGASAVAGMYVRAAENFTDTSQGGYLTFETNAVGSVARSERMRITAAGGVGIGGVPQAGLDVATLGSLSALIVPRDTVANRPATAVNGMIRYASDTAKLEAYQNGTWQNIIGGTASSLSLSNLTAATAVNTIDNTNFAQTWNWSTATTQTPLALTANQLTTGSLLSLTSSNASLGSTNGLLNVANSSTSTTGVLARFQANSSANSGLYILTNGYVGIATSAPTAPLHVFGDVRVVGAIYPNSGSNAILPANNQIDPGGLGIRAEDSVNVTVDTDNSGVGAFGVRKGNQSPAAATNLFYVANGGNVGVGTNLPQAGLDVATTGTLASALIVPRDSTANRPSTPVNGMIRYASDTAKFEAYQNGSWQNVIGGSATSLPLSGLTAATAVNTIDNTNFAQTWNWSNTTTQTALALSANSLTTGSALGLTSSSNSLGVGAGLLNVTYTGTSTTGSLMRLQGTGTTGAGLYALSNGNVGIGTATPSSSLEILSSNTTYPVGNTSSLRFSNSSAAGQNLIDFYTAGINRGRMRSDNSGNLSYVTYGGGHSFYVNGDYSSGVSLLGLNSIGSVGIGGSITPGNVNGSAIAILQSKLVGINSTTPMAALDINGNGTTGTAVIVPRDTVANRPSTPVNGMIRYASDTSNFEVYQNGNWQNMIGSATTVPFSGLTAATATNTIDNTNFAQTWNWSTATSQTARTETGNALTSGSLLTLSSTSAALNTNSGILNVLNAGTSTSGVVMNVQSNSSSASGLTVLASNYVGIGTTAPSTLFQVGSGGGVLNWSGPITPGADGILTIKYAGGERIAMATNGGAYWAGLPGYAGIRFHGGVGGYIFSGPLDKSLLFNPTGGNVGIGTTTAKAGLDIALTGTSSSAVIVPRDTVANRPSTPVNGMIRYASDTNNLEAYQNGAWINLIGSTVSVPDFTTNASVALGSGALSYQTTGTATQGNTAIGYQALQNSGQTSAARMNTALGYQTGVGVTTGSANTFLGYGANSTSANTTATTVVGANSTVNTGGAPGAATVIGANASCCAGGIGGVVIGASSSGSNNGGIAINGTQSGNNSITLNGTVGGVNAISIGIAARAFGQDSVTLGPNAGLASQTGQANVLIGPNVGRTTLGTGSKNILIGTSANVDTPAAATSNFLNIGSLLFATGVTGTVAAPAGMVGIGTAAPQAGLDVALTGSASAIIVPRDTVANRPSVPVNGMIRYASDTSNFEIYQNGNWQNMIGSATSVPFSGLTAAAATNTIDNTNYAQTWNWSTATSQSALSLTGNSLTSGSLLNLTSSNGGLSSTNGLLNVANTGTSTNGIVARIQSSSAAASGLTVLANGRVGIGTTAPFTPLHVNIGGSTAGLVAGGTDGFAVSKSSGAGDDINMYLLGGSGSSGGSNLYFGNVTYPQNGAINSNFGSNMVFKVNGAQRMFINSAGYLGIASGLPQAGLDVATTGGGSALIVPRDTVANRPSPPVNGMIRYASDTNNLEAYQNGSWVNLIGSATSVPLSGLTAATATNTIDNTNFAQTWNWSTATSQNALTETANSLTTGSLLSLSSSSASLNSANGLLSVVNSGTSTSGLVTKIQSNSIAGSGLYVLANGNIGIGTATPVSTLQLSGSGSAPVLTIGNVDNSTAGGVINFTSNFSAVANANKITASVNSVPDSGSGGRLIFSTSQPSSGTLLERVRIDASGRVGIGTNQPQTILTVDSLTAPGLTISVNGSENLALGGATYASAYSATSLAGDSILRSNNGNLILSAYNGSGSIAFTSGRLDTTKMIMLNNGSFGIGSSIPAAALDVAATGSTSAIIVPRDTTTNRPSTPVNGMIRYATDTAKLETFQAGSWQNLMGSATSVPFSGLTAATATNTIDNTTLAQTWNWSTATTQSLLTVNANALTSGTGLTIASTSGGLNSSTGLLNVANNGTSTNGLVARILSNSVAGSGLSVTASGNIGIGTSNPSTLLYVNNGGGTNGSFTTPGGDLAVFQNAGSVGSVANVYITSGNGSGAAINLGGITAPKAAGLSYFAGGLTTTLKNNSATAMTIIANNNVGIGTVTPMGILDLYATGTAASAMVVPRDTVANRPSTPVNGMIRYASDTNNLEAYQNGSWVNMIGTASILPFSGLTAATAVNTLDNTNFAQTWNWSTAATQNPLTLSANALTTGSLLTVQSSNNALNSTNGLLSVVNTSTASSGLLAKFQANSSANSGLYVLANGNVGIGVKNPVTALQVAGNITVPVITNDQFGYNVLAFSNNQMDPDGLRLTARDSLNMIVDGDNNGVGAFNLRKGTLAVASATPLFTVMNSGNVAIGSGTAAAALDVAITGTASAIIVPRDTVANRPSTPVNGMIRYASDTAKFEGYQAGSWVNLIGSGTGSSLVVAPTTQTLIGGNSGAALNTSNGELNNTAFGYHALNSISTGSSNVAIGTNALMTGTSSSSNVAIGVATMQYATTAGANVGIGDSALTSLSTGGENVGIGYRALAGLTTGTTNIAFGSNAMSTSTTAYDGIAIGKNAMSNLTTGAGNVAVGRDAGQSITTGGSNVAIGYGTGRTTLTTGSNNILIGAAYGVVDTPAAATSNFLNIGNVIFATGMNGSVSSPAGSVGIGTNAPSGNFEVRAGAAAGPGSTITVSSPLDNAVGAVTYALKTSNKEVDLALGAPNGNGNLTNKFYLNDNVGGVRWVTDITNGNFGIGTQLPQSKLDVNGGVGIGSYAGVTAAPANGLIVSGSVGIGTASPTDKLQVNGNVQITGNASMLRLDDSQAAGGSKWGMLGYGSRLQFTLLNSDWSYNNLMMTILNTGKVGIGTGTPTEMLHVVGNLRVQGSTDCTLGNGSGGTNCSSDARLKMNVSEIASPLAKVLSLRGVEFDWNERSTSFGRHDIGVIAQDVEKVFPTAVVEDHQSGFKMVDYAVLVAPLIQAVKEMYHKLAGLIETVSGHARAIDELKRENERLRRENDLIKERLDRVEAVMPRPRKVHAH